jgi:hypothetical protein
MRGRVFRGCGGMGYTSGKNKTDDYMHGDSQSCEDLYRRGLLMSRMRASGRRRGYVSSARSSEEQGSVPTIFCHPNEKVPRLNELYLTNIVRAKAEKKRTETRTNRAPTTSKTYKVSYHPYL